MEESNSTGLDEMIMARKETFLKVRFQNFVIKITLVSKKKFNILKTVGISIYFCDKIPLIEVLLFCLTKLKFE